MQFKDFYLTPFTKKKQNLLNKTKKNKNFSRPYWTIYSNSGYVAGNISNFYEEIETNVSLRANHFSLTVF